MAQEYNLDLISSNSPIQALLVKGNKEALAKAQELREKGFSVKAILSPTIPEGKERIRFCIHSYNEKNEIEKLIKLL